MKPYKQDQADHRQADYCQVANVNGKKLMRAYFNHQEETRTDDEGNEQTLYTADYIERYSEAPTAVELAREEVTERIEQYDKSTEEFTLQGDPLWLDWGKRDQLRSRFDNEEAQGLAETTLWSGTKAYTLPITQAREILAAVEAYAIKTYDNTARHKAEVAALATVEEIAAYDYEGGYPDKLTF